MKSPLLLSLFSTVLPLTPYTSPIFWTAADAVAAWALVRIWRLRTGAKATSRDGRVAAMYVLTHSLRNASVDLCYSTRYLLNPYIFLPSLALSSSSIENALALLSLMFACRGEHSSALFSKHSRLTSFEGEHPHPF